MAIITFLIKSKILSFFCTKSNFEDVLACLIGKHKMRKLKIKVEHPALLLRYAAAQLSIHEEELLTKIARFAGWKVLEYLPTYDLDVRNIDWSFCMSRACLPLKYQDQYVGIACCNPDLLPAECLEQYDGRIYLITFSQLQDAVALVQELLTTEDSPAKKSTARQVALIDDRFEFINAARLIIEQSGAQVVEYQDVTKLLNDISKSIIAPDLIISDINMPSGNGFDLVASLERLGVPKHKIYLASSDSSLATELLVLKLGIGGFVSKQKGPEYFAAFMQRHLETEPLNIGAGLG